MGTDLIKPLPYKDIEMPPYFKEAERETYWRNKLKVIFFDPIQVYENINKHIDPFARIQKGLNCEMMFPKRSDGICRCGCNQPAKREWACQDCRTFAYNVYFIIVYGTQNGRTYIEEYYGRLCFKCQAIGCEIDHIIPVKHGGGGCWLSNFVPLCSKCHKDKTKQDFKWGQYKPTLPTNQININF